MDSINRLRIELADEVASLPSSLHSEFPDLAVDWLAIVFKGGVNVSVPRLDAASAPQPVDLAEPRDPPRTQQPPLSQEQLSKVTAKLAQLALEADRLEATAVPPLSDYGHLLVCSSSSGGGGGGSSSSAAGPACPPSAPGQQPPGPLPLVKCRRCSRVLLPPAAAAHAAHCQLQQAVRGSTATGAGARAGAGAASLQREASSLSEDEEPGRSNSRATSRGTKGSKRKRPAGGAAGGARSKASKGSGGRAAAKAPTPALADEGDEEEEEVMPVPKNRGAPPPLPAAPAPLPLPPPPLQQQQPAAQQPPSPAATCPAASRRRRSAWPSRTHRHALAACPILNLTQPLQLNPPPTTKPPTMLHSSPLPSVPPGAGVPPSLAAPPGAKELPRKVSPAARMAGLTPVHGKVTPPRSTSRSQKGQQQQQQQQQQPSPATLAAPQPPGLVQHQPAAAALRPAVPLAFPAAGLAAGGVVPSPSGLLAAAPAGAAAAPPRPVVQQLQPPQLHQPLRLPGLPPGFPGALPSPGLPTSAPQLLGVPAASSASQTLPAATASPPGLQIPPFFLQQQMALGGYSMLGQTGGAPILMRQSSSNQNLGALAGQQQALARPLTMVPQAGGLPASSQGIVGTGAAAGAAAASRPMVPMGMPSPMARPGTSPMVPQGLPQGLSPMVPQGSVPGSSPMLPQPAAAGALPGMQLRPPTLAQGQLQLQQQLLGRSPGGVAVGRPVAGQPQGLVPGSSPMVPRGLVPGSPAMPAMPTGQQLQQLSQFYASQQFQQQQQQQQLLQRPVHQLGAAAAAAGVPARPALLQDLPPSAQLHQPFYLNGMAPPLARPASKAAAAAAGAAAARSKSAAGKKPASPVPPTSAPSPGLPSGPPPGGGLPSPLLAGPQGLASRALQPGQLPGMQPQLLGAAQRPFMHFGGMQQFAGMSPQQLRPLGMARPGGTVAAGAGGVAAQVFPASSSPALQQYTYPLAASSALQQPSAHACFPATSAPPAMGSLPVMHMQVPGPGSMPLVPQVPASTPQPQLH